MGSSCSPAQGLDPSLGGVGEEDGGSEGEEEERSLMLSEIGQLDGNITLSSIAEEPESMRIPVWCGYRPPRPVQGWRRPARRVVRRDNRLVEALSLPTLSSYNMRAARAKLRSLAEDIEMRDCQLSFLCEIWEKSDCKNFQGKVEEILEMSNIQYLSNPRQGNRKGGGVGIAHAGAGFQVTKLNVKVEKPLEVVWALYRNLTKGGKMRKIILISFYSPPRFGKKNQTLVEHIFTNLNQLRTTHPGAGVIMAGDVNNLKVERLLAMDTSIKSINKKATRGDKCIDVILTDLWRYYQVPEVIQPVPVDQGEKGVPSDHKGLLVKPRSYFTIAPEKETRIIQPMPDSLMSKFDQIIQKEDWSNIKDTMTTTEMVDQYEKKSTELTNKTFPFKTVLVKSDDKPHFTEELRLIKRQRQRIYQREGKSEKYLKKKTEFKEKEKKEACKHREKIVEEVMAGKRCSAYKAIRKLGDGPEDTFKKKSFILPSHADQGLSPLECAEDFADYFAKISQSVPALDEEEFFPALKASIREGRVASNKPVLQEYEVYNILRQVKKTGCTVPEDVPQKLMQEFCLDFAAPATKIFNAITKTGEYPRQFVQEFASIVPKSHEAPQSAKQTRTLSMKNYLSKSYEKQFCDWLWPYIEPFLDPNQWGGRKNRSTTHYLIKLFDFVHKYLDKSTPHAVATSQIDLQTAYNLTSHQLVIEDLFSMKVPGWLLVIMTSFLTSRKLIIRYRGATSSARTLDSGSPAGCMTGNIIFLVKFNGALLRPPIPRPLTKNTGIQALTKNTGMQELTKNTTMKAKYIDDITLAVSINLRKSLIKDPESRPKPLNFHERFQLIIKPEENVLQAELDRLLFFTDENYLKINLVKSSTLLFNNSTTLDFPPEFGLGQSQYLQEKTSTKLLGVIVNNKANFGDNTEEMVRRGTKKLWLLRRMRQLGLDSTTVLKYWTSEGRPLLENACALWTGSLTVIQSRSLEAVQRSAMAIADLCTASRLRLWMPVRLPVYKGHEYSNNGLPSLVQYFSTVAESSPNCLILLNSQSFLVPLLTISAVLSSKLALLFTMTPSSFVFVFSWRYSDWLKPNSGGKSRVFDLLKSSTELFCR